VRLCCVRPSLTILRYAARKASRNISGFGVEIEPQEYDRKRRAEWTRPWDDDYEEVRAESPDMFDEYDDKERAHYLALTQKAAAKRKKKAA
jgi:hypothetical protein